MIGGKKEGLEIVSWKDQSGFAKWSRAPLEANYYDGSYRSSGETWKPQLAALLVGVEGLLLQLWN